LSLVCMLWEGELHAIGFQIAELLCLGSVNLS